MNRILPLIFLILIISCNRKHFLQNDILETLNNQGWIEVDSISYGSKNWYTANYSKKDWKVNVKDDKLILSKFSDTSTVIYKLSNGYLEGTDNGEWGGRLSFNSQDTITRRIDILKGNINSIFRYNQNIYLLEGLAHLNMSEGKLIRLTENNGIWKYKVVLDLKDKPYAYTVTKENELYIVTFKKLIKIMDDKIVETIIDSAFWESLYPNSIMIINNNAIIGMRGVIATVNLKSRKITAFEKQ